MSFCLRCLQVSSRPQSPKPRLHQPGISSTSIVSVPSVDPSANLLSAVGNKCNDLDLSSIASCREAGSSSVKSSSRILPTSTDAEMETQNNHVIHDLCEFVPVIPRPLAATSPISKYKTGAMAPRPKASCVRDEERAKSVAKEVKRRDKSHAKEPDIGTLQNVSYFLTGIVGNQIDARILRPYSYDIVASQDFENFED